VPIKEHSVNTTFASRADAQPQDAASRRVLVWDAPVRVFHWLMVLCFAGAFLSAESERFRLLHVTLGYTMGGLVAFRIVWGIVGTRYARFSNFVRGPAAIEREIAATLRGSPARHTGHNPAGAAAILALLCLAVAITASGWAAYDETGGEWLKHAHEIAANAMLAVIGVHIAGVLLVSRLGGENLIGAMITGRKAVPPEEGVRKAWHSVAAIMLAAVLGFWWLQWQGAPSSPGPGERPAASSHAGGQAHDGD
jgi:cytochrome b